MQMTPNKNGIKLLYTVFCVGGLLSLVVGSFAGALIGSSVVCRQPEEKPEPQLTIDELCQYLGLKWWTVTLPDGIDKLVAGDKHLMLCMKVVRADGTQVACNSSWSLGWKPGDKVKIIIGQRDGDQVPYMILGGSSGSFRLKFQNDVAAEMRGSCRLIAPHTDVEPGKAFYKFYQNPGIVDLSKLEDGELGLVVDFEVPAP